MYVLPQLTVERMAGHGFLVTENDDFHAGSGDGDVHASQVAEETYLSVVVGAHERDDDDVALLSLEAVDGIDADKSSEGLEKLTFHQ